jgi:asparagine synthase (glutamine-hydrolysing)
VSGVAAVYERSGAPADVALITAMLARLRRRGPDRSAQHADGSVALAHAMLATTPEDAIDRQPLRSRTRQAWIVADARVDNRRELEALRAAAGEPAGEVSDAELLLWAYQRWGEACPSRIVGDFAFVIWDAERRCLFCARDRLGVRQLYYHVDAGSFRCASEMQVLFADGRVARRPHRRSMALFLTYNYAERDETLYEDVRALPPGHVLVVTATSIRREAYWQPDPWRAIHGTEDDYAARFREVFSAAVGSRLRASRPVAAQVSGGLDSSSVACEAERLRRAGLANGPALTLVRAVFPGLACDERRYSQAVADHLGLPIVSCSPADVPDLCRLEQAYPDLYFHPTLTMIDPVLDDVRRQGIRVVLTGAGGDQMMQPTGYEAAHDLRRGRVRAAIDAVELLSAPLSRATWRRLAGQALWAFAPRATALLRRARRPAPLPWPWLSREAAEIVRAHLATEERETRSLHPDPHVAELCRGLTHGVGNLLPAALDDRAGAMRGLELRHPFTDVRVVELLLALPSEQRVAHRQSKRVLRRAMGGALPSLVRERVDKAEFGSYVGRVFLQGRRDALQRLFRASLLEEHGLVEPSALRRLLDAPPEAQDPLALTNLTAMELWLRAPVPPRLPAHSPKHHEDRHEHA